MPQIHIHTFRPGRLISTILCDERTIECKPERLSLFIALHSVASHYNIPTAQEHGTSSQFFIGHPAPYKDKFELCSTNREKINYACDILNKPHIFKDSL